MFAGQIQAKARELSQLGASMMTELAYWEPSPVGVEGRSNDAERMYEEVQALRTELASARAEIAALTQEKQARTWEEESKRQRKRNRTMSPTACISEAGLEIAIKRTKVKKEAYHSLDELVAYGAKSAGTPDAWPVNVAVKIPINGDTRSFHRQMGQQTLMRVVHYHMNFCKLTECSVCGADISNLDLNTCVTIRTGTKRKEEGKGQESEDVAVSELFKSWEVAVKVATITRGAGSPNQMSLTAMPALASPMTTVATVATMPANGEPIVNNVEGSIAPTIDVATVAAISAPPGIGAFTSMPSAR